MDGPKLKPTTLDIVEDDDREPTKEEIMEDIRQGLLESSLFRCIHNGMPIVGVFVIEYEAHPSAIFHNTVKFANGL